jgi:nucleotide-binding universal stress UspA family protein
MSEPMRILFPTDDSMAARAAEPWLGNARWETPPDVEVLVVAAPTIASRAWLERAKHHAIHSTVGQLVAAEVSRAEQLAAEVADRLRPVVGRTSITATNGEPAREVLARAGESQPDLIVLGPRGRSEFAAALLGSVSQQVVAHSTVPVLVARPGRMPAGELPQTIVLVVDGTLVARSALAWLLRSGWLRGARIVVGGLLGVQPGLNEEQPEIVEEMRAEIRMAARDALHELAEMARSQAAEVTVELQLGHPLQAALAMAEAHLADLLVVARRRPQPGDHPLADKIGRYAGISVLMVPVENG